jgi:dihydroorotase
MPGVETLLPLMLDQASRGVCSLQDVVRWTGENPYKLYGVKNKGAVLAGYDADLVLVDLNLEKEVRRENLWTKVRWSPYEGMRLRGWPRYTLVRGHVVFHDGVIDEAFRGEEIRIG